MTYEDERDVLLMLKEWRENHSNKIDRVHQKCADHCAPLLSGEDCTGTFRHTNENGYVRCDKCSVRISRYKVMPV